MRDFQLRRLRSGEVIAGASGALLLIFLFALTWYALSGSLSQTAPHVGAATSWTGWSGLNHLRWFLLLTSLAAVALAFFQASQRAPAIPVTLSVFVTVLGVLSVLALIYRVLISPPSGAGIGQRPGAYLGLVAAIGIVYGGYRSMREEAGADIQPRGQIETVRIEEPAGS